MGGMSKSLKSGQSRTPVKMTQANGIFSIGNQYVSNKRIFKMAGNALARPDQPSTAEDANPTFISTIAS
jgi:hypothetical protein